MLERYRCFLACMQSYKQESVHKLRVCRLILLFFAQVSHNVQFFTLGQIMKNSPAAHLATDHSSHEKAAKHQSISRWSSHACICIVVQHTADVVKDAALMEW